MALTTEISESPTDTSPFTTALIDTSLLIEQQKRPQLAEPVRRELSRFQFKGASSYSKLEFKRAWLQKFAYLFEVSQKKETRSLNDLLAYLNRTLANQIQQRKRLQTCIDMLTAFFDFDGGPITSAAQLARFRAHCKRAVLDSVAMFPLMITGEFKGTRCVRAEENPAECPDGSLSCSIRNCTPKNAQCAIHQFFLAHQGTFKAIADYVDANPAVSDELKRMRDHIRLAQGNPMHLCDGSNCAKLADAIIAVDGQEMDVFAANNDKEWIPISTVMKKPLLNPVHRGA